MMSNDPAHDPTFGGLPAHDQAQIDRLCDAFEQARRKATGAVSLDGYLSQVASPLRSHLLRELVSLDVEYHVRNGRAPQLADYVGRYPELDRRWLQQLLAETSRSRSASAAETPTECTDSTTRQVIGDYELVRRIGRGGMGEVYLAHNRLMHRDVAIKLLSPTLNSRTDAMRRFMREVATAARLTHPNIVTAYHAGQYENRVYLVMQFVAGADLRSMVHLQGPLSVATAVDYTIQAARGLAYAHEQGVVHRDVKPSNLLVGSDGVVKVLDMGLARMDSMLTVGDARLTTPHMLIGTVGFMAPEQSLDAANVDHRADIYSLGCTLYFLLTGRAPYTADSVMDTILAHQREPIPSLSEARPDIPPVLADIFTRMMAKNPDQRFPTMQAAIEALLETIRPAPSVVPPPVHQTKAASRLPTRIKSSRSWTGVVAAVAVIAAVPAIWSIWSNWPGGAPPALTEMTNALGMVLVRIPPADSVATSDSRSAITPAVPATLQPFWMGSTEVTVAQFRQFAMAEQYRTDAERSSQGGWGMENGGWVRQPGYSWERQGELEVLDDQPATNISWNDAIQFCEWLSRTEKVEYRLPSESEWEFACRAGTRSAWYWGDDPNRIAEFAWFQGNSDGRPHAVAGKPPNAFGLYDILGNEMEWCRDEFPDDQRVQRGGSFLDPPDANRCDSRVLNNASSPTHGSFRVVRIEP